MKRRLNRLPAPALTLKRTFFIGPAYNDSEKLFDVWGRFL